MSGAYPPPPPGFTLDPLPQERRPDEIPPPPPGFTVDPPPGMSPAEPSFWRRLGGTQPGPLIPSATPDQGSLWPVRHTPQGMEFDPYAGLSGMFLRGITAPGDVATGRVPITGPTGGYNPDLMSRAGDFANTVLPANPAARAGERGFGPRPNLGTPTPPLASTLKESGSNQYNDVRQRGPDVLSQTIADRARQTSADLSRGFDQEQAGNVFSTLTAMLNPTASWTPMTSLLARRDRLAELVGKGGSEGEAARQALGQVNDLINTQLGPTNTRPQYAGGPYAPMAPAEVGPTLAKADLDWGAAQRSNMLSGELDKARTGLIERSENRRGNPDISMRRGAEALLERDKTARSLVPGETAAVDAINKGGFWRNLASDVGTTLGSSGLSKAVSMLGGGAGGGLIGAALGGLPGMGIPAMIGVLGAPALGAAARRIANAGARTSVQAADELMRRRSAMFDDMVAAGRTTPVPLTREGLLESLLKPELLGSAEGTSRNFYPPAAPPKVERRLPPGYI